MGWKFHHEQDQDPSVTLGERLQYVVDQGWVKSRTQWSLAAGLSKGLVSHIINGISHDPKRGTLLKLARSAEVSAAWLISEVGGPKDSEPADFDVYPTRAALVEVLALDLGNRDVIRKLRTVSIYDTDPGVDEWVRLANRLIEEKTHALESFRASRLALPE